MSEILSNIVLQPINSTFVAETNALNVNPEAIQLNIFTAGSPGAGQSSNGELLYNNLNNIDGLPNAVVTGNTLRFTNLANLKINGGTNSYFLQTDGTGNLTWAVYPGNISGNSAPGGANTQIQYNDGGNTFGGSAGFTFDKTSNAVYMPGDLWVTGNINGNIVPNYANFAGTAFSVAGGNVSGPVSNAAYADNAGFATNANYAAYAGNANIANTAGTVTTNAQPNITSVGTLTSLSVNGTITAVAVTANTGVFTGNGSGLSSIAGANVTGTVGNATTATTAGTVTTNAQPNITSLGILTTLRLNEDIVVLGNGANANATGLGVSIGYGAGATNPGYDAIAIGDGAGGINQGSTAMALGVASGRTNQGSNSIAIGPNAGHYYQGFYSVAIGASAGATNQANNTVVLNATGANLNGATANAFYVKPIRTNITGNSLYYDVTTGEISYGVINAVTANTVTDNAQPNITSVGTLTSLATNGAITANGAISANGTMTAVNITANTGIFTGNGIGLTNIAGANVTGRVANANIANIANAVSWGTNVAIGNNANVNATAIAIGTNTQARANGISIGAGAGGAVGLETAPQNNTIIINATGANMTTNGSGNICMIKPIANVISPTANTSGNILFYNRSTGEIKSGDLGYYVGTITANTVSEASQPAITSLGTLTNLTVTGNISGGNLIATGQTIKSGTANSATIGTATSAGLGARKIVTDATAVTFQSIYSGGGANIVPVYSDGTNWRIG